MNDRAPIGSHDVVDHAITTRQSIRAFLPTPVPRATIEEILAVAARAPSGTNTQPMSVPTVEKLDELLRAVAPGCDLILQQSAAA